MAEEVKPQDPPITESTTPKSQQMISDMPDVFSTESTETKPDTSAAAAQAQPTASTPPAGSPPATPAGEQAVSPVIERLRSLGFRDVSDEKQGTERLISAFEQSREQQETLAMQIDQLRQQNLLMQSQLAQSVTQGQPGRQAPASASTPSAVEPDDPWPKIPELDIGTRQAIQKYRTPDGGWQPNTPPTVMQKAMEFQAAVESWSDQLTFDPKKALQPIIDHEVKKAVQQILGGEPQKFVEQQLEVHSKHEAQQTEVAQAWERVSPWMWQADPVSQQQSKNPTEFGRRFQASFQQEQARIKQLNPTIDDDALFFHSMQGAYWRHESEIQGLEYQWQQYQASQQQPATPATPAAAPAPQAAQVDPREKARQDFLARNRQNTAPAGQRSGSMPEDGKGRKRGPRTQGANAVGVEFVNSLAGDGFFAGA